MKELSAIRNAAEMFMRNLNPFLNLCLLSIFIYKKSLGVMCRTRIKGYYGLFPIKKIIFEL